MTLAAACHEAIGRAVVQMQMFETNMVVTAEFFHLVTRPKRRRKTGGFITAGMLEEATTSIVHRLKENGQIAPNLEGRIRNLVTDRHLLVHNWVRLYGLGSGDDMDYWSRYRQHAISVESEARAITLMLLHYVLKWAEPEWAKQNPNEYLSRIRRMFIDAGNGDEP
jgi:hypothetical protein